MPPAKLDVNELRELIENQKLTHREAAKRLGVSQSCVGETCRRNGLQTQRTGPRNGPLHPEWKGGRVLVSGYWYIWTGREHPMATKQGYVAEHRLAMAEKIGRPLKRQEVVHHIDGDPNNNRIDNLMLFRTNAEHLRHELTGKTPNHTPEGKARMLAAHLGKRRPRKKAEPDALARHQAHHR